MTALAVDVAVIAIVTVILALVPICVWYLGRMQRRHFNDYIELRNEVRLNREKMERRGRAADAPDRYRDNY